MRAASTSVTARVTAGREAREPTKAVALTVEGSCASTCGEPSAVRAPCARALSDGAASAPPRLKLTAPPCTSFAAAVYTTVEALVPSATDTLVELVMVGATSVIDTVTAWLELSVPSEATTLKLYQLCVSKSGAALKV